MSNEEPFKGQSKFNCDFKTAQKHREICVKMSFCQKVAILTKIRLFLEEKSDIRP